MTMYLSCERGALLLFVRLYAFPTFSLPPFVVDVDRIELFTFNLAVFHRKHVSNTRKRWGGEGHGWEKKSTYVFC